VKENTLPSIVQEEPVSKTWGLFWVILFITCLSIFTLARLPREKINAAVTSLVNEQLKQVNLSFSSDEGALSFSPGVIYTLQGISISKIFGSESMRFSSLEIDPHWLFTALGKPGFDLIWEEGTGIGTLNLKLRKSEIIALIDAEGISLGSTGILTFVTGLSGNGELTVKTTLNIARNQTLMLSGPLALTLRNFTLDLKSKQNSSSAGQSGLDPLALISSKFSTLRFGEIALQANLDGQNIEISELKFSKASQKDSLLDGTIKGTITMGRDPEDTSFQLQVDLKASDQLATVLGTDPLLKSLVAPYEKAGRLRFKASRDPRQMPRFDAL